MKIFKLCHNHIRNHIAALAIYIVLTIAIAAIGIFSPYIIGSFLDNLIEGADLSVIIYFCIIFGGLSVLGILSNYITTMLFVKMQTKMAYDLNMETIKHVQHLSLSHTNNQNNAYLSQRITNDSATLTEYCITILQGIMTNTAMFIVPFFLLLRMNLLIAVLLICFLFAYVISYFAFRKPLYDVRLAFTEAQSKFFSRLYEQLKYIKQIKLNSIQPEMGKRADEGFESYRNSTIRNQRVNYFYTGMDGFVSTIAQIVLFVVGGIQVLRGNFTIGMFTIFTSYFNMMLGSSRYFFGLGANYQNALVSYNRITEFLTRVPETCGAKSINDIDKIQMEGVHFSYDIDSNEKVLSNLYAKFEKGTIYAISGANGTGKSTLINLIMGMYVDEFEGFIKYDGVDIRQINMTNARKFLFGYAEQEPALFNESIGYNLTYGNSLTTCEGKMLNLIKTLGMEDFMSKHTLDYMINEGNNNTSGGEKQKISILKVLLKDPSVIILDEPTSALDMASKSALKAYLDEIKKEKIIIVITHDNDFINNTNDVVINIK